MQHTEQSSKAMQCLTLGMPNVIYFELVLKSIFSCYFYLYDLLTYIQSSRLTNISRQLSNPFLYQNVCYRYGYVDLQP